MGAKEGRAVFRFRRGICSGRTAKKKERGGTVITQSLIQRGRVQDSSPSKRHNSTAVLQLFRFSLCSEARRPLTRLYNLVGKQKGRTERHMSYLGLCHGTKEGIGQKRLLELIDLEDLP